MRLHHVGTLRVATETNKGFDRPGTLTRLDAWAIDRGVLLTAEETASLLAGKSAICDVADAQGLRRLLFAERRVEQDAQQHHVAGGVASSLDTLDGTLGRSCSGDDRRACTGADGAERDRRERYAG